jgi:hypothetical protein
MKLKGNRLTGVNGMGKYTGISNGDWIRTAIYLLAYVVAVTVGAILMTQRIG